MNITNHKLLRFRILSPIIATVFAVAVYAEVKEYFMFPIVFLQMAALVLAIKLKCNKNEQSLTVVSRGCGVFLIILYVLAVSMGIMVAMQSAGIAHSIAVACFYVVVLDALMAIPFVLSFSDKSKWQHGGHVSRTESGSETNHVSDHIAAAYADSDYDLMSNETYWPQSDYHANSITDSSLGVNPASGLPMANDAIDIGGNVYGFGDASFANYDHHTSQFSDFDYHNHS